MSFVRRVALSQFSKVSRRSFATYKTSTGLVGLNVDPNGRENLLKISNEILESVKKIPATATYRIHVEKWYTYFAKTCMENEDIKAIEDEIALGQIEEVIVICKDELILVDFYHEHKGWELVADEKARADELVASMADSIYFFEEKRPPKTEEAKA